MSPLIPIGCRSAPEGRSPQNPFSRPAYVNHNKSRPADKERAARLAVGVSADRGLWLCRICLLLSLLGLAACSSSQPIEKQSKIAASASQTATMVVDAWAAGAAPSDYASATLQSTDEILAAVGRQIQSDNSLQARGVITAIGQLSAATRQAQAGVEAGNPRRVSQALQDLRMATADLAAAAKHIPPKS